MNCTNCGNHLDEGTVFCSNCGNRVDVQQPAQPAQQSYPYASQGGDSSNTYGAQPNSGGAQNAYGAQPNGGTQNAYGAPAYGAPAYGAPAYSAPVKDLNAPMSLGQYMLTMLIGAIPLVGFVFMLIWAFSSDVNVNKKNYCRAVLLWMAIGIVASILFAAILIPLITSLLGSAFDSLYYYGW